MRREQNSGSDRSAVGRTLVTARSWREYRDMFGLSEHELGRLNVLDCPGGASDFAATVTARGGSALAVDPVYGLDQAELATLARSEADRSNRHVAENRESYHWDFFADPDAHALERIAAVDRFLSDRQRSPDRYVAASLPELPFADGTFGLAVCSYLLFVYDDRFDAEFHRAALCELLRVATEVRVYPVVDLTDDVSAALDPAVEHLRAAGVEVKLERSSYRFQPNADRVLVARR